MVSLYINTLWVHVGEKATNSIPGVKKKEQEERLQMVLLSDTSLPAPCLQVSALPS